jgi:acyl dehydratase
MSAGAASLFFEDVVPGQSLRAGPHTVTREAILAFGRAWDPFPFHADEQAAAASPMGGLIASGVHTLAVKQRLVYELPIRDSAIASLGHDALRYLKPVRPGTELWLVWTWVGKRLSQSQPGRGIVQADVRLEDAAGEAYLRYTDNVMMRVRG